MSTGIGRDKEVVVHMHNGILAIIRNTLESVLMRWIQSEVSQKEKDKYCILTHIYEI